VVLIPYTDYYAHVVDPNRGQGRVGRSWIRADNRRLAICLDGTADTCEVVGFCYVSSVLSVFFLFPLVFIFGGVEVQLLLGLIANPLLTHMLFIIVVFVFGGVEVEILCKQF
jgi:hypothetical protein